MTVKSYVGEKLDFSTFLIYQLEFRMLLNVNYRIHLMYICQKVQFYVEVEFTSNVNDFI